MFFSFTLLRRRTRLCAVLLLPLIWQLSAAGQQAAITGQAVGTVYVMTNRANGNTVQVYRPSSTGLQLVQEIPTRGLGTGVTLDPLMSQGALALRNDGKILVAVNPASGDLTAFVVTPAGLKFGSKVSSYGALPVSVTIHAGLVYVVNQLGLANIAGFRVDGTGQLQPIANSSHVLAGAALALPAQVSFTPNGSELLVTEKGTDQIDIFRVHADGSTDGPIARPSAGKTPFGFTFGPGGSVVVTEAERRLPMRTTVSSYHLGTGVALKLVSARVPNQQTGACWAAVTGQTAWIVNTGTANISSYQIAGDGTLTLINPIAAATSPTASPIDTAASSDGRSLYLLESGTGAIAAFQVNGNTLTPLFVKTGLPLSIQGLAVQ